MVRPAATVFTTQEATKFAEIGIMPRCAVGTTLLVKGLEFHHAIVLDADAFNAFNQSHITGRNTTYQVANTTSSTVVNNVFDASGNLVTLQLNQPKTIPPQHLS